MEKKAAKTHANVVESLVKRNNAKGLHQYIQDDPVIRDSWAHLDHVLIVCSIKVSRTHIKPCRD